MALHLYQLCLLVADLTFASALSCILYVLGCLCLASLLSFVLFLSSFGVIQTMKRNIGQKGKAILILVSKSAIGAKLIRKLDKAGFSVLAMYHSPGKEGEPLLKKEWSSNTKVEQRPVAEEKYQKAVQNLIESQPPLKEHDVKQFKCFTSGKVLLHMRDVHCYGSGEALSSSKRLDASIVLLLLVVSTSLFMTLKCLA